MPNTVNSYLETDLGNVSPNPRGEYNATYDYEYLDLIYYKGGSYLCLAPLGETIKNVPPIIGQTTTNWQCVAIPGDLTPEYISMYNEVVKDYNETNANTADVAQMKASTYASMTAAQESESKASTSETNARNSEVNAKQSMDKAKEYSDEAIRVNNDTQSLVTGFDEHVATAISNAKASISESTDNAKGEIVAQKSSSLNEFRTDAETVMTNEKNMAITEIHQMVDNFSADADSKKQEVIQVADEKINDMTVLKNDAVNAKNAAETAATTAVEKASEATTSADEAKASSNEAKANAELVAADKAIVAADKTEIGGMKSAVESSVAKFESDLETYNIPTMNNDINALKGDLDNFKSDNFEIVKSENLLNPDEVLINGKYTTVDGNTSNNPNYVQYNLDVEEGKRYRFSFINSNGNPAPRVIRFITAYDKNGNVHPENGTENAREYIVPNGISHILLSINAGTITVETAKEFVWTILQTDDTVWRVVEYFDPYYIFNDNAKNQIKEICGQKKPKYIRANGELNSGGGAIELEENQIKSSKKIIFTGNVTTLGTLTIAHGTNVYDASYIEIDATEIRIYYYTRSANLRKTYTHGLNISDNIQVIIESYDNQTADIRVCSQGILYNCTADLWIGAHGVIGAYSNDTVMTNCTLSFTSDGYDKDIQLYGDSYFGMNNSARWVRYMVTDGYSQNCLIDGYAGRGSIDALNSFKRNLSYTNPKYAVWCLGMNDPDTSEEVNTNWKSCVDEFISICIKNDIIPILATIPTVKGGTVSDTNITQMRIHKYKNTYVRNSGYRYIDFDKAVNASETTGEWYNGMLSDDGVHPTQTGAKTLYLQALADVPELAMNKLIK